MRQIIQIVKGSSSQNKKENDKSGESWVGDRVLSKEGIIQNIKFQ